MPQCPKLDENTMSPNLAYCTGRSVQSVNCSLNANPSSGMCANIRTKAAQLKSEEYWCRRRSPLCNCAMLLAITSTDGIIISAIL